MLHGLRLHFLGHFAGVSKGFEGHQVDQQCGVLKDIAAALATTREALSDDAWFLAGSSL